MTCKVQQPHTKKNSSSKTSDQKKKKKKNETEYKVVWVSHLSSNLILEVGILWRQNEERCFQ